MFKTPTIQLKGRVLDVFNNSGHGWEPGEVFFIDTYGGNSGRSTGHTTDGRSFTINPTEFEVILDYEDMVKYEGQLERFLRRVRTAIEEMDKAGLKIYSTSKLARAELYEMLRNAKEHTNEEIEETLEEVLGVSAPTAVQDSTE